ncbi:YHYH protein [Ekhidna sp. To15]|uniref:YHYH protein n=1 Tax=Ekhidna sp. To15 TaxID=3395267 RepID=UPI003F525962
MKKNILLLLVGSTVLSLLSGCGGDSEDDVTDEFSATVTVSASSASVAESAGTANFIVSLSTQNTSGSSITIPFSLSGTATENGDFEVSETSAVIASDATSATIQISITDDTEDEQDETIIITLGSLPSSITAGSSTDATITITDNDESGGTDTDITVSFGSATGSSIGIDNWTDTGADSYIVLINSENSFEDFTSNSSDLASSTYIGYGQQVVYNGSSPSSLSVSLLEYSSEYFFKVVPVADGVFDNSQEASSQTTDVCITSSTTEGQVCFEISSDSRTIISNQLANHTVGTFPNGVPTAIEVTRELDLTPTYTNQAIYVYDETGPPTPSNENFWQFGMATNGVEFHPMGLKPWENPDSGEENWEWQAKVTEEGETGLDAYGAHVTTQGNYHYHGDIVGLADDEDGSRHSLIYGFAADGFPIYYKYGYSDPDDPTSTIVELESSYQLKSGARTGTGIAGEDYPDGNHDGTYIQDFEYVQGLGDLDECNGRTGVTPEYPDGTYYYVITAGFPVTPNCFFGTPADDWKIGQ